MDDRKREILREKLLLTEANAPAMIAATALVAAPFAWMYRGNVSDLVLMSWVCTLWICCAVRYVQHRRLVANPPTIDQVDRWRRRIVVRAALTGVLVSTTGWIFFDPSDVQGVVLLVLGPLGLFIARLCGAGLLLSMVVPLMVLSSAPIIVMFFLQGTSFFTFLGFLVTLFQLAMLRIARVNAQTIEMQIRLKLDNRDLALKLEQERERAERANRAKSRFLAAASHDIRQPVHALGLFLGAFDDQGLNDSQRELVARLRGSAQSLREMLDSILDLSHAESGTAKVAAEACLVQKLLDDLEREFAPLAEAKGLAFRVVPTRDAVYADPVLLGRMLRNLVSNAVRYTESGGVLVACRRRAGRLALEVWDTGVGIPEDKRELLFEEFMQLGDARGAGRHGLGLGLAIVERLAGVTGTGLSYASRPGRGSVFRLEVERLETPATHAVEQTQSVPDMAGMKVLVLDDDAAVRASTRLMFEKWGCDVAEAADQAEALAAATAWRESTGLIVSDKYLANGATGNEAIAAIRRQLGEEVPAIIVTGGKDSAEAPVAQDRNSVLVLRKPLGPDALHAAVTALHGLLRPTSMATPDF